MASRYDGQSAAVHSHNDSMRFKTTTIITRRLLGSPVPRAPSLRFNGDLFKNIPVFRVPSFPLFSSLHRFARRHIVGLTSLLASFPSTCAVRGGPSNWLQQQGTREAQRARGYHNTDDILRNEQSRCESSRLQCGVC